MKNRYWLLPVLMILGSWLHALICEWLARDSPFLRAGMTLLLFVLTALILNRACTRKGVLISAAGLLFFCLVLTGLELPLSVGMLSLEFALPLAYLWEVLFFPYLSLPLPGTLYPFTFLLPALIPFIWALFCKPSS